jgi:hypothetical protein
MSFFAFEPGITPQKMIKGACQNHKGLSKE